MTEIVKLGDFGLGDQLSWYQSRSHGYDPYGCLSVSFLFTFFLSIGLPLAFVSCVSVTLSQICRNALLYGA